MQQLDIIIATYNRHQVISSLVGQIEELRSDLIKNIVIVDSSDILLSSNKNWLKTKIIHSKIKSQPYQRFVGYKSSESDFLLFLDDDMEIIDKTFPEYLVNKMKEFNFAGINLKFENKNIYLENTKNKSIFSKLKNQQIFKIMRCFFGYPILEKNKLGWNGNKGFRKNNKPIDFVSGGAFVGKKDSLFVNFNYQLFDVFEKKLGMGEDTIIGYLLSKQGIVHAEERILFYHNDTGTSTYTNNEKDFVKKVFFSRWYLSKEYARINNLPLFYADIAFFWYFLWRLIAILLNTILLQYSINYLRGCLNGLIEVFRFSFKNNNKIV